MAAVSTVGFPIDTGKVAHDAVATASESQRRSDIGAAQATYNNNPANYAAFAAAVLAADFAHLRRLAASMTANNLPGAGDVSERIRRMGG